MLPLAQRACHLAVQREPLVQAATFFRAALLIAPVDAAAARTHFTAGFNLLPQLHLPDPVRRALEHDAIRAGVDTDPESAIALLRQTPAHAQRGHLVNTLLVALVRAGNAPRAHDLYEEFGGDPQAANIMLQATADPAVRRQALASVRRRWRERDGLPHNPFASGNYFTLLAEHWSTLPRTEAETWLREAVDAIAAGPDQNVQAGFGDAAAFTRLRDMQLFQLLNALQALWPPPQLDALFAAHPELAIAARRYPRGMQSIILERMAEARPSAGTGFAFSGAGPDAAARQLPLALCAHAGDPTVITSYFADAQRLFHEDTDPAHANAAPRVYWPSCGAYRQAAYWTGKLEGIAGEPRLNQVPDHDFLPLALLDFAAGVLQQPYSGGVSMRIPPAAR